MTEYNARAIELAEQLHEKALRNLEAYEREEWSAASVGRKLDRAERKNARPGDREPHAKKGA